jgi:protein gp37
MAGVWNPWRGCRRCSTGCKFCYIHKGDAKRGVDTSVIVQTKDFRKPQEVFKNGLPKLKPGLVYTCFTSDFLIEDADAWRDECWRMMAARPECQFLFLTKRILRLADCLPADWGDGYDNVTICCTVEDQQTADERLPAFLALPVRHRCVTAQPLVGPIDLERCLGGIESVTVGGESDKEARTLDYTWVLDIREQCVRQKVAFDFRQCGTHTLKDGRLFTLPVRQLCSQARKAGINYRPEAPDGEMRDVEDDGV